VLPWKKPVTSDHVECLKWSHGDTKYEIFISILDNLELMFLSPHCLDAKEKIEQVVSDAHLSQALFRVFPRTVSTVLRTIWDIMLQDQQPAETEAAFDLCLRSFIDSHSTTDDRHDLINQLHQAHKPREILVQNNNDNKKPAAKTGAHYAVQSSADKGKPKDDVEMSTASDASVLNKENMSDFESQGNSFASISTVANVSSFALTDIFMSHFDKQRNEESSAEASQSFMQCMSESYISGDESKIDEINYINQDAKASLLKDEIANGSSPRSLTVLPAYGSQATKNTPPSVTNGGFKPSIPVPSKRMLSWAEIASR
jgi:hypothetical protein